MAGSKYTDVILEIEGEIGVIKLNRPKQLNSLGGSLVVDCIGALRELDVNTQTVFTVITGNGRFFSAGADVNRVGERKTDFKHEGDKKVYWLERTAESVELVRSLIDHKKVLVVAMNGPGVGAGASWFQGVCDLLYMAEGSWLQVPFSQLGVIPETGIAVHARQSMGMRRATEWLIFGERASAEQLCQSGFVNRTFPADTFHSSVMGHLRKMLEDRSGRSMMEVKRLQNKSLRDERILALFDATDALAETLVEGEMIRRLIAKREQVAGRSNERVPKL